MPFDTTYYFSTGSGKTSWKLTKTGGKDTAFILKDGATIPATAKEVQRLDSLLSLAPLPQQLEYDVEEKNDYPPIGFVFAIIALIVLQLIRNRKKGGSAAKKMATNNIQPTAYLTYYGDSLNFSDEEIITVLEKHFLYFSKLSILEKEKFINRIQLFIADKVFKIHCNPGYKEMPILISAAAVQLTFGLKKYLLPNFKFIHVYPQEFVGLHPTLRVLEGNVSGHAINLSWKHFLEGYKNPANGQNVGLHELAHALYYQTFVVEENVDRNFKDTFDGFSEYGNKAFEKEQDNGHKLYTAYALKSLQEFWAESIEIFFEKPWQLKAAYPALYSALVHLLNQDPCITTPNPGTT